MKLYEVNQAIQDLADQLNPDPETGEVTGNIEEVILKINALQMEKKSILEYLAKIVLDTRASAAALKDEEKRLKERRTVLENKEKRLISILDRECEGTTTDCGVATMYYRKTSRVAVTDNDEAVSWLKENGHEDCYKVVNPEVSKSEVKKLLKAGTKIPGVQLENDVSCSLR